VNLDISPMGGKPIPYLPILVVGSVVLDEMDFAGEIASDQSL
jgi:hypothetical protein